MTEPPLARPPDPRARSALRSELRARREALPPAARITAARNICHHLEAWPAFMQARKIGGYWACGGEVPLNLIQARLAQREQTWWLPRIQPGRRLVFARWEAGDPWAANRFGIPEPLPAAASCAPAELDLVLVPLLGFDARGNRLGMGGGYYDTSFACRLQQGAPARPLLVGIAHAFQELRGLEAAPWDVPLDHVVTEGGRIDCRTAREEA